MIPQNARAYVNQVIFNNRFIRNVFSIASGTIIGQAVVFLTSPILTRLYSPEDFGIFAVFNSMLAFTSVIGALRYEVAIPMAENDDIAANLLSFSIFIAITISSLTWIVLLFFGGPVLAWTNTPDLQVYIWLLPIGILGASTYTLFNYWAIRKDYYSQIGRTKFVQGTMLAFTQIGIGIVKKGPFGLLFGQVIGQTAGMTSLAISALRNNRQNFFRVSVSGMIQAAKRYRRFPLIASYTSLLNSIGTNAPAFLLSAFYGPAVAGIFALSQRVIGVPLTILGNSIAQVFLGEASKLLDKNQSELRGMYLKTAKKLFFVSLIFAVPIGLFAPFLFSLVFGADWEEAGRYAQIMTPMMILQFVISPLSQTLNVLERQDLQFLWVIIYITTIVGGLFLAHWLGMKAYGAILLCSVAMSFSYIVHFLLCIHVLNSRFKN